MGRTYSFANGSQFPQLKIKRESYVRNDIALRNGEHTASQLVSSAQQTIDLHLHYCFTKQLLER